MDPNPNFYKDILNRIPISRITEHPNILIAAGFWDEERYLAAKTCYAFMRRIDDMIDNFKASHQSIGASDRAHFIGQVEEWLANVGEGRSGKAQSELVHTLKRFRIPPWTLEEFARSMVYDVNHDGFSTIESFLDYSEGATVAPSSIFVHLCGIQQEKGNWADPPFDVREVSRPCAIFSYLVHIMRDFQKDQLSNLNYFADDRLKANNLTRPMLRRMAEGEPLSIDFRNLMKEYCLLADEYRQETLLILERLASLVEPRYFLSLQIIFNLYLMVFEKIDPDHGTFTMAELNPTSDEIYERVSLVIREFSFHSAII